MFTGSEVPVGRAGGATPNSEARTENLEPKLNTNREASIKKRELYYQRAAIFS